MNRLEGANCADLPGFVIDKYFGCDGGREPLRLMVARAICARCVVLEACREQALNMPALPTRGVMAGATMAEIRRGRRWRAYESGLTDQVPTEPRPDWLARTEATEIVEAARIELDPDEGEPGR